MKVFTESAIIGPDPEAELEQARRAGAANVETTSAAREAVVMRMAGDHDHSFPLRGIMLPRIDVAKGTPEVMMRITGGDLKRGYH